MFPVRRGQRDEEAFKTADAILKRGGLIVMYVEGGRSRSGELGQVRARASAGWRSSTACRSCPTAIAGTERVRNWKRFQFPKVTVQFGEPVRFEQVDGAHDASSRRPPPRSSSTTSARSTRACARTAAAAW